MTPTINTLLSIRRSSLTHSFLVVSLALLILRSSSSAAFVTNTLSSKNTFIKNSPFINRSQTTEHEMTTIKSSSSSTTDIASGSSIIPLSFVMSSPPPTTENLETSQINDKKIPPPPTTVFLHGLDSSSQTWSRIQQKLSTPSIAIDVRGCGSSPMGNPDDFAIDTVVDDIKSLLHRQLSPLKKFVLVGHSMGAKIATYYTQKYPNDVAALVMEDMDIRRRSVKDNPIVPIDDGAIKNFDRRFDSYKDMVKALTMAGYPADRIEKWRDEGRIRRCESTRKENDDGAAAAGGDDDYHYWWCDVNPEFRFLCYRHFCDNDSATQAWRDIAAMLTTKNDDDDGSLFSFSCHLLVAAPELTICSEDSIREMCDVMPGLNVRRWKDATHSIHNSAQDEFLEVLEGIIKDVSL